MCQGILNQAPTGRNKIAQGFNSGDNPALSTQALKGRNNTTEVTLCYALAVLDLFIHRIPRVSTLSYRVMPRWG